MSDEDIFYDSLEEDERTSICEAAEGFFSVQNSNEKIADDLDKTVPLYKGEIPKNKITQTVKKKSDKNLKPFNYPSYVKAKKSYLTMYYEKMNRLVGKSVKGSNTSRADCEALTPKRDADLEVVTPFHSNDVDSDGEENFYKKFLEQEMENRQKSTSTVSLLSDKKESKASSKLSSQSTLMLNWGVQERNEKLELLKKRQSYGMKMSMRNKIRIEELKSLKKIKNSNLGRQ
ncbi:hypothetical protein BDFB_005352 [Asbolus verrucosus]|uniref:Uncharacterized protein n=1 Tax=Asbolus verrucosus TaxID=1661398 RepID=A0A482UZW9_ASBVE|nr:hypothetical protein BDFB_005352 [Asbolus verrucosus]